MIILLFITLEIKYTYMYTKHMYEIYMLKNTHINDPLLLYVNMCRNPFALYIGMVHTHTTFYH